MASNNNNINFTPRAQKALQLAYIEAARLGHKTVETEHILLGIVALGEGVAVEIFEKLGVSLETIRREVENSVIKGVPLKPANFPFSPRAKKVLGLAANEAKRLGFNGIATEHLLLGLLREDQGEGAAVLKKLNITLEGVLQCLGVQVEEEEGSMFDTSGEDPENGQRKGGKKASALKAFGRDLTEMARAKQLDPVIGRQNEIQRVMQILCRRTKNNPVLLGEAGVGKTAIVEGLAQKIADEEVPEILRQKKIVGLDLARMLAGTKYRGQFEERIKALMDEIRESGNIIIFIDELHTIVGAGSAEGTMDVANIIKPALSRGEFQCVGATTLEEYRKFIEKDAALERRFQSVKVEPPSTLETIQILRGIRFKYEEHHRATITDAAIDAAVRLSDRYITSRFLPDKAIDVIDEAGSYCRMAAEICPPEFKHLEKEIEKARQDKEKAIAEQRFEDAAVFRDTERQKKEDLDTSRKKWRTEIDNKKVVVDEADVTQVVSRWTGVPLRGMEKDELKRLLSMEKELSARVIGQSAAVSSISKALRRSRADLKDPNRPIGVFMLLGPTGVGKTLLSHVLAESMFGDAKSLIQLDMSEYMEKFTVSRLVGSPPGYVGYDEGGQLTEKVRRRPYSVVLFDEIEKAHPDVWNILLQILEEGKLTDSMGHTVDFRNTIILLTSNVGAEASRKSAIGFGSSSEEATTEQLRVSLMEEAKKVFKPEFLNRLDEILVFRPLNKEDLIQVLDLEMSKLASRLELKDITLKLEDEARDLLIQKGYNPVYGARPMRRTVEQMVQDPLAEEILRGHIRPGELVKVGVDKERLVFYQDEAEKLLENQQKPNIETTPIKDKESKDPHPEQSLKTNRKSDSEK
ncbi:MAG: ATP-dependent Clp protease ATP-binding subunit [Verrucomicrobia bacterium]|nr:ATP-dependent Clp protease ATP-binding subunit [Verrucomicrobiota bacterium]MBR5737186.1 ATP-dependent Clp protease ATP-binding subunit [Verrucomicrobiota bacterium]